MTIGLLWDITMAALFILGGLAWFASRDTYRRPLSERGGKLRPGASPRGSLTGVAMTQATEMSLGAYPRSESSQRSHGDLPQSGRGDDGGANSRGAPVPPSRNRVTL